MSGRSISTLTVVLHRDGLKQPWGCSIAGGCDLGTPLVITRSVAGQPAGEELKPGDIIRKIGDYDARDVRHQDAQMLFKNAGNSIRLVVQRETASSGPSSRASSAGPPNLPGPPSRPPPVQGGVATPFVTAGVTSTYNQLGTQPLCPALVLSPTTARSALVVSPHRQEIEDEMHAVTDQPYRTTPLVLPGAKVKKDAAPTESYLRHHPNPMFRAPPPSNLLTHEVLMKQRVADTVLQRVVSGEDAGGKQIVNRQFNSPIGLYSEQNIVDTIHASTATPFKPTVVYDPAKSETYRALQESELGGTVQEITTPVTTKVFSPARAPPKKVPQSKPQIKVSPSKSYSRSVPHAVPAPHTNLNSLGNSEDEIHQSNTFKRLMYMVMNEESY